MITAWILYAGLVGTLLGAAALALERFLRVHSLPSRWIWVGAIFLSAAWPLAHWTLENRATPPPPASPPSVTAPAEAVQGSVTLLPPEPITVEVPPESILRRLDGPVLVAWAVTSGALFLFFLALVLRTGRMRRRWREGWAGGRSVLISEEWGPAVVGVLRPRIVLPGWCEEIDEAALALILDHELEHVRAGDLKLLLLAGIVPVLLPWHLPVWWQLARLRTAIEGDCDLRVLRRHPNRTRPYVDLLLEVGERASRGRPVAAMLSEPYQTLKRRIKIMTMPLPKRPLLGGGLLTGAGLVLLVLAGWAPGPTDAVEPDAPVVGPTSAPDRTQAALGGEAGVHVGDETQATAVDEAGVAATPELAGGQERQVSPVFTPYTVLPEIQNREEVQAGLREQYSAMLTESDVEGTTQVWFFMDEEGVVQRTLVNESSGHKALDDTAIRVADIIEFSPALNRDQGRPVWISLPIEFTTGAGARAESGDPRAGLYTPGSAASTPESRAAVADLPTGDISGVVTDASTGEALLFVQIFVLGTGDGTLSNREGRFLIRDVPVGEREVVAQLVGFEEVRTRVRVTETNPAEAIFELEPMAITMKKLVVRGSG